MSIYIIERERGKDATSYGEGEIYEKKCCNTNGIVGIICMNAIYTNQLISMSNAE